MAYSFIDLVIETLKITRKPLTQKEIWENAVQLHISQKVTTSGKTPWATLGARIYTDIKDNENTPFIQVSKRPAKFYLKELHNEVPVKTIDNDGDRDILKNNKVKFYERDLHLLLVRFL